MADQPTDSAQAQAQPQVRTAEFPDLAGAGKVPAGNGNLDLVRDIQVNLQVELGRTDMTIQDILELTPGKVVELDRLAGEPLDIVVNGKLLAKGEVVVVDENFGVRITSIIDPQAREVALAEQERARKS
jgi:flagellar motor switch protein FliN/FliY